MQIIRGIYTAFKREVIAIIRDRLYLISLVVLPVVMMLFFVVFFAHGSIDNLPIAVVDNDHSAMSRRLTTMIDATRGVEVAMSANSTREAQAEVLKGEIYGYVVVPRGFESGIIGGEPQIVDVVISGANLSAAGILRSNIQESVTTLSSGVAISKLRAMGVGEHEVMSDVMPINALIHILANPYLNYGYYLAPMFMFVGVVVFTMLLSIYAVGRELRYGTACEWLTSASNSLFVALVGKLLPVTIVMTLIIGLIYALLTFVMGMAFCGSTLLLMLISLLFILAYQSIAIAIVAITANMRLALSLGGGYAVMAFTFSGITFPTIAMYGVAQVLSHIFPFTYFSKFFINYALFGADISYSSIDIMYIVAFILTVALSWRRLDRVVRNSEYWSRD